MPWWAWIILGAVLLGAEIIISADFYLVFFGLSGLLIGLLALIGLTLPVTAQWLLYAALAVSGVLLYRMKFRAQFLSSSEALGPEIVDEEGTAKEAIAAGARGKVELRGTVWEAINDGTEVLEVGARCTVTRVEGLTLFVRSRD